MMHQPLVSFKEGCAFFWRITTPFRTFLRSSGLPFLTLQRTKSPGEQFLAETRLQNLAPGMVEPQYWDNPSINWGFLPSTV